MKGADWSVSSINVPISLPISPHRVGRRLRRIGARQGFHRVNKNARPQSVVADVRIFGYRVVSAALSDNGSGLYEHMQIKPERSERANVCSQVGLRRVRQRSRLAESRI